MVLELCHKVEGSNQDLERKTQGKRISHISRRNEETKNYPISNGLHIKSDKKTFKTIMNLFVDLENDITTYENFCTAEEIKAFDVTRGNSIGFDSKEQAIYFITNFDPIVPVIEKLVKLPAVDFEYSYEMVDDEEHEMCDYYSGGVLVSFC